MKEKNTLHNFVKVRGHFYRSVQLKSDWQKARSLSEYIITSTSNQLGIQILEGIKSSQGPKAWSIIGPFGTGKSSFSLFLIDLLCRTEPIHPKGRILRNKHINESNPFFPVILSGHRTDLNLDLLLALSESFFEKDKEFSNSIKKNIKENKTGVNSIIDLFSEANNRAKTLGYGGILILIDEFGKYLEYAAHNPNTDSIFTLQYLAELSERSNPPILLITVLHTSFTEYLINLDYSRQLEWQKIQGRFTNAPFLEPSEQLIKLVGSAIISNFPQNLKEQNSKKINSLLSCNSLIEVRKRIDLQNLVSNCLPIDPITTLILPSLFRSKLAQNERSLFAFLTNHETYGFQDYLSHTELSDQKITYYRLDLLYDYVINSMGSSVFVGDRSHRWSGIESVLQKIPLDWPTITTSIVKIIGLIGIYGSQFGLRPDKEILKIVLDDDEGVESAIDMLSKLSLIIYRKHEDAFGLWEGSDVNLEVVYEHAKTQINQGYLSSRLQEIIDIQPIVARSHYIRNGAMRYFEVKVEDGSEESVRNFLSSNFDTVNGIITYFLSLSSSQRSELINFTKKHSEGKDKLRILAFPNPINGLEIAIQEFEIWKWIFENIKELQGDPVARQEVRSQMIFAKERLTQIAGHIFNVSGYKFSPIESVWIQNGEIKRIQTDIEFQRWLSELLDEVYYQSPKLLNELVNRDDLSTSASAARRNLINAMINKEHIENLGFSGNPAEYSIYLGLVKTSGFHKLLDEKFYFHEPDGEWRPVWKKINKILIDSQGKRQAINNLFEELRKPPYGLKNGILPIILCTFVLSKRNQIAMFENGIFTPELRIEVFERLMRAPHNFEIQLYELDDRTHETIIRLNETIKTIDIALPNRGESLNLVQIVKPLVLFAYHLPESTKKTKNINPKEALLVRDTLLKASDPYSLIFEDLPNIFGITILRDENINLFIGKLSECLISLKSKYPSLLNDIEYQIRTSFSINGNSEQVKLQINIRAKYLTNLSLDPSLGLFIREASRIDSDPRDWREILGRAINSGIPPTHWNDRQVAEFQVRLFQISSDFTRLEELFSERNKLGETNILQIGFLNKGFSQDRIVVPMLEEEEIIVNNVSSKVSDFLSDTLNGKGNEDQIRLAIYAKLILEIIQKKNSKGTG